MGKSTQELWAILRTAVLDGTFNQKDRWKALTSKSILSRLAQQVYLESVENFFQEDLRGGNAESSDSDESGEVFYARKRCATDGDSDDELGNFLSGDVLAPEFRTRAEVLKSEAAEAAREAEARHMSEEKIKIEEAAVSAKHHASSAPGVISKVSDQLELVEEAAVSESAQTQASSDVMGDDAKPPCAVVSEDRAKNRPTAIGQPSKKKAAAAPDSSPLDRDRPVLDKSVAGSKINCWSCGAGVRRGKKTSSRLLLDADHDGDTLCPRCLARQKRRASIEKTKNVCGTARPAQSEDTPESEQAAFERLVAEQATLSIRGANETSCLYNCAHDVFSMLLCDRVVWTGRWKDVTVVRSGDHRHCIIRPHAMTRDESDDALLTFFVGLRILEWNAFEERKLEHEKRLDEIRRNVRTHLLRTLHRREALTAQAEAQDAQQHATNHVDALVSAPDASARPEHRASRAKWMLPEPVPEPPDRVATPARLPSAHAANVLERERQAGASYSDNGLSSSVCRDTETVLRRSDLAGPRRASQTRVGILSSTPRGSRAAMLELPTDAALNIKSHSGADSLLPPAFQTQSLASAAALSCWGEAEALGSSSSSSSSMVASFKRRLLTSSQLAEQVTLPHGSSARSEDAGTESRPSAVDLFGRHQLSLTPSRLLLQPTVPRAARSLRALDPEQRVIQRELGLRPHTQELLPLATHRSLPHLRRQQPRDA